MASFTNIQNPGTYSPVAAPIYYVNSSIYSGYNDFKYIYNIRSVQLNSVTITGTYGTFKVPPRPVNGYGEISMSDILKTGMSYNIQPYILKMTAASQSIVKYNIDYTYQYNPSEDFEDIVSIGGTASLDFGTGSTSVTTNISAGDTITVVMDNQSQNPQYNSTFNVVAGNVVSGHYYVGINSPYSPAFGSQSGTISMIRKGIIGNIKGLYAYNGTRQYNQINQDFGLSHVELYDANLHRFLSNYRDGYQDDVKITDALCKRIFGFQYETLSFMLDAGTLDLGDFMVVIKTFDQDFNVLSSFNTTLDTIANINDKEYKRWDIPCGTAQIELNGWVPLVGVTYYSFIIQGAKPNMARFFKIVDNCSPYPNNFRLAFLNQHGGFDYWNFNWKSTNTIDDIKTSFKQVLPYNYNVGDRQDTVLAQKSTDSYMVSSDWITEYESNFLKELIRSKEVYFVDENQLLNSNNGGTLEGYYYYPINITDSNYVVKTSIDNKLFSVSVNFKFAQDQNILNS
jgi:hypothetical protein